MQLSGGNSGPPSPKVQDDTWVMGGFSSDFTMGDVEDDLGSFLSLEAASGVPKRKDDLMSLFLGGDLV